MRYKISLPYIEFVQESKIFYCEDHLIRFLLETPKVYSLIYSRDLGFTKFPLKGFKILNPFLDGNKLIDIIKKSLIELYSEDLDIKPFKSLSIKDTFRYILTFIIGLGYGNRPPKVKVSRRDVELRNAIYYVKNVLGLNYEKSIDNIGFKWLNLEVVLENNRMPRFFIIKKTGEIVDYRVLELLTSSNSELRNYILELGSE